MASSADGSIVVIGAPNDNGGAGEAYVYVEPTGGWGTGQPYAVALTSSAPVSGSGFGDSVAISADGNTVVVGAPNDNSGNGAVYVFSAPGVLGWGNAASQSTNYIETDSISGEDFGISVAVSNGANPTIVVGAENGTVSGYTDAGAAYVFHFDSLLGWQPASSPLNAGSDAAASELFGGSVAITSDGGTILVGATGYTSNTNVVGAAYVFTGATSTWSSATGIYDPTNVQGDAFGTSVAISGTSSAATAVIGAPGTSSTPGSAYVFTGTPASLNTATPVQLTMGNNGDLLGKSVAISADATTIAVGAPDAPPSSSGPSPTVFEFDEASKGKNAGIWSSSAKSYTYQYSKSEVSSSGFGDSVAVGIDSSGTAWIFGGAPGLTSGNGGAFVFTN